jgi:hypothetical protein
MVAVFADQLLDRPIELLLGSLGAASFGSRFGGAHAPRS